MASRKGEFGEPVVLDVDGFDVRVSSPERVYFAARGETKLDLVHYYLSVGDGIVNALRERPCMLHRFPDGVSGAKVHQKRLPRGAPPWVETVRLHFPRYGLHADELCVTRLADVAWAVQMSTVEFHPWNSRRADTEKPDEWRIDLDPMPDAPFSRVRRAAHVAHEVLDELGAVGGRRRAAATGCTSTCGSGPTTGSATCGGRRWPSRGGGAPLPDDVTTTWWRKDRDPEAVFVDYNQNARDHTIAAAYSVRGNDIGTVSTPVRWDEIDDVEPRELTIADGSRSGMPSSATSMPASTRRSSTSRRCWSGRSATRPRGRRGAARARGRHGEALMDLVVPPGPGVPQGLTVPGASWSSASRGRRGRAVRASTPPTAGSSWSSTSWPSGFTDTQRGRVLRALDPRLVGGGCSSWPRRSTGSSAATASPPASGWPSCCVTRWRHPRRPAGRRDPTRGSIERRLAAKKRRGETPKPGSGRPAPRA